MSSMNFAIDYNGGTFIVDEYTATQLVEGHEYLCNTTFTDLTAQAEEAKPAKKKKSKK